MNEKKATEELRCIDRDIRKLTDICALLGWDQETYMPGLGVEERGGQLAILEGLIHKKLTGGKTAELLSFLNGHQLENKIDQDLVCHLHRLYKRNVCIPTELVERKAQLVSRSQAAWAKAREENRFDDFQPHLEEIVDISRDIAQRIGYQDHPYTALVDEYEPGMTTSLLEQSFGPLEHELAELLKEIKEAEPINDEVLYRSYPEGEQEKLGRKILSSLGFDWGRGRLDRTTHPFCTTLGFHDVRLTTRYEPNFFPTALYGMIHEGGHGLYEQGFDPELMGSTLANGTSLGIHESQSRFWENIIGRSQEFVQWALPIFKNHFSHLGDQSSLSFYRSLNKVQPSLIRVEADEVTYTLHVILRFKLEKALMSKDLQVKDLPMVWNETSSRLLGLKPSGDKEGVLQDIHWAMGAIGYFPTYALGNLYSAQFSQQMDLDLPQWKNQVSRGEFQDILQWLRQNIHFMGSRNSGPELIKKVTGIGLSPEPFLQYIQKKFRGLYGI